MRINYPRFPVLFLFSIFRLLSPKCFAFILLSTFYFLFSISLAQGASFYFDQDKIAAGVGDSFRVDVLMDSPENVNAVEGVVRFSGEILEVQSINDGNSIISLWIQHPEFVNGQIAFSGAIPGGFPANGGKLFSVDFKVRKAGTGSVSIGQLTALLNDGWGSAATVSVKGIRLSMSSGPTGASVSEIVDENPPENFLPVISVDPNIFDGKKFVNFTTQDKGSGLARYESTEQRSLIFQPKSENWEIVQSPYLLKDQEGRSWIGIRAIDHNGNVREVWIIPKTTIFYRYLLTILGGIIVVFVVALVLRKRRK